ncbi:MAG: DNA polymerase III subunit delta [Lachnospiraceae bacterium]|nr:DNA polymerase III subunit delta [Lachnospiraceae bacterium]
MQKLNEEIKSGQFKQVYLLYGEEAYLIRQYRDKLKDALTGGGDSMNYHYFEGKDISVGEVIDLAETMPFLADRRVIVMENSGLFKHGGEQLAEYLKEPSETAFFVLAEREIDKRSKLFKAITAKGRAVEFKTQDESTLKRWILGILKKENKKIAERDLELFLEKTGTDMENISKELEKLICYCMDKEVIAGEDIEAVCTRQVNNQIFEMMNAIAEKRQKEAMKLYYDLLTLKEPPMRILFLLARQFNLLLQVKELKKKGYPAKTIGENVGLPGFVAGKYVNQAAGFSTRDLRTAVTDCVEAEEAVKTGKMDDVMSVELLLIKYSTKQGVKEE